MITFAITMSGHATITTSWGAIETFPARKWRQLWGLRQVPFFVGTKPKFKVVVYFNGAGGWPPAGSDYNDMLIVESTRVLEWRNNDVLGFDGPVKVNPFDAEIRLQMLTGAGQELVRVQYRGSGGQDSDTGYVFSSYSFEGFVFKAAIPGDVPPENRSTDT